MKINRPKLHQTTQNVFFGRQSILFMLTVGWESDVNLFLSSHFVDDPNESPINSWGNRLQIKFPPFWRKWEFSGKSCIIMKFWLVYKTSKSKSDFDIMVHSMLKRFQEWVKQLKYSFSLRGFVDQRPPWPYKHLSKFWPQIVVLGYNLERKRFWAKKRFSHPIRWRKWLFRLFRMRWKCFEKVLDG